MGSMWLWNHRHFLVLIVITIQEQFLVVLLAIVDAQYRFVYVDAGSNGRIGDSSIWRDSDMLKAILKLDH